MDRKRIVETVLVVEDEPLIRWGVAAALVEAGYHVREASHADEAIALLEKDQSIRLVFTDVQMPGSMDGLKLAWVVRDRWPPIHIIITSGHGLHPERDKLPDRCPYLPKPYEDVAVISAVRELLAG
jgi:CheY-like chemotaxis protein